MQLVTKYRYYFLNVVKLTILVSKGTGKTDPTLNFEINTNR